MQFKAFEEGIEVNGQTVYAFVDGMGEFKALGEQYMSGVGIGRIKKGKWLFDRDGWYPQQAWLDAMATIAGEVGDGALYRIGCTIPSNAQFPSGIADMQSAIRAIDIAYHINHRKNGKGCLYDAAAGVLHEGIGHYGYEHVPTKNFILSVSHNPYPCAFDRGIISAMARKYDIGTIVIHDDSRPCRKNGAETCTYLVSW
ncbi:MAG: hypothetical protein LBO82_05260 [Synergistaceae bacterium]|jgi:hypothetical protein|nr:hypothetical protein [Synergistaceae bacterium]